jgi:hypothetical protein
MDVGRTADPVAHPQRELTLVRRGELVRLPLLHCAPFCPVDAPNTMFVSPSHLPDPSGAPADTLADL